MVVLVVGALCVLLELWLLLLQSCWKASWQGEVVAGRCHRWLLQLLLCCCRCVCAVGSALHRVGTTPKSCVAAHCLSNTCVSVSRCTRDMQWFYFELAEGHASGAQGGFVNGTHTPRHPPPPPPQRNAAMCTLSTQWQPQIA